MLRQRSRLAAVLVGLSDEEWAAPSRCRGWSVQDVIEHLVGVNRYWAHSVTEGLKGTPTRLLTDFDPVSVPASMVDAARGRPPSATLDAFTSTNDRLTELWSSLDEAEWSTVAEAPPGHLALRAVAVHALWDSWIHERDVLLPLSRVQPVEADEVELTLAYAAAIGPAFRVTATAEARSGTLAVIAHHPEITLHVDQGEVVRVRRGLLASSAPTVEGDAVRLAEGFSRRGPHAGDHRRGPLADRGTGGGLRRRVGATGIGDGPRPSLAARVRGSAQRLPGAPWAGSAGSTGASGAGSVRSRWLGSPSPRKIPEAGVVRLTASAARIIAPAV